MTSYKRRSVSLIIFRFDEKSRGCRFKEIKLIETKSDRLSCIVYSTYLNDNKSTKRPVFVINLRCNIKKISDLRSGRFRFQEIVDSRKLHVRVSTFAEHVSYGGLRQTCTCPSIRLREKHRL